MRGVGYFAIVGRGVGGVGFGYIRRWRGRFRWGGR